MGDDSDSVAGGGNSDVFSVIGEENDSVDAEQVAVGVEKNGGDATAIREQSDAVGQIVLPNGNVATGFLVAPDIIMTNSHVVQSKKEADPTGSIDYYDPKLVQGAEFNNNHTGRGTANPVKFKEVILSNQEHDVAFVRLDRPIEGVKPLQLSNEDKTDARVYTIGHPAGEVKQIGYYQTNGGNPVHSQSSSTDQWEVDPNAGENAYYESKYKNAIMHTSDTKGGSSGSPLIDADTGKVLGVHFTGYQSGFAPYKGQYNAAISTNKIRGMVMKNRDQLPPDLLGIFGGQ